MRYFLNLSYKGTNYHGWQVQKNAVSVQEVLNHSLSTILRKPIDTVGSGRTDTGVHAAEQVAHFDTDQEIDMEDFEYKLNSLLPRDIAVNHIKKVKDGSHARFDAKERTYIYYITTRKNPFATETAYYFRKPLDLNSMNNLKEILVDWKDYESFSRVKTEVDHFLCDIHDVQWLKQNSEITFTVSANRFLRGMVRAMAGTMLEVGMGNIDSEKFKKILESRDRRKAGTAVPPHGLFLQAIKYPSEIYLR